MPIKPVCYTVDKEEFDKALKLLHKARYPSVVFIENLESMREDAANKSRTYLNEATDIMQGMITE